jgi:hypothetical protein
MKHRDHLVDRAPSVTGSVSDLSGWAQRGGSEPSWTESNCYIDMWIGLLLQLRLDPRPALPFTVRQDFEGDQFTFLKFPLDNLDLLYGLDVRELAIFGPLEEHVTAQVQRGCIVIVEVDAFYLPDTRSTTYRQEHSKTTIGIDYINRKARRLGYFHNATYGFIDAADYDGVLQRPMEPADSPLLLPPYVEFVRHPRPPLMGTKLVKASVDLFRSHLARTPAHSPIADWRKKFAADFEKLLALEYAHFHLYSFNHTRQLGANFELLAKYLRWLDSHGFRIPEAVHTAARTIADETMVMQFRIARALLRRKYDRCDESFDALEAAYDRTMSALVSMMA